MLLEQMQVPLLSVRPLMEQAVHAVLLVQVEQLAGQAKQSFVAVS